jgi:hypothetical protein
MNKKSKKSNNGWPKSLDEISREIAEKMAEEIKQIIEHAIYREEKLKQEKLKTILTFRKRIIALNKASARQRLGNLMV